MIRLAGEQDLSRMLTLYKDLHKKDYTPGSLIAMYSWKKIVNSDLISPIVFDYDGKLVSSCVLTVTPSISHFGKSYGLIENVVTMKNYRGRGFASMLLNYAVDLSVDFDCYKVMLMTGRKDSEIERFYNKCGFVSGEKVAYIHKIEEIR